MRLSNIPKPYPDELLLSYFFRTLNINGIYLEVFEKFYVGQEHFQCNTFSYEIKKEFLPFYQCLPDNFHHGARELFLALSTFPFQAIFMTQEEQMQYVNNVFRPVDRLNTLMMPRIKDLCICPTCWQEDIKKYNEPYFHRVHQLPGMYFCPTHHTKLYGFSEKNVKIAEFSIDDYRPFYLPSPEADLIAYSEYAQALLLSDAHTDISHVIAEIKKEFARRGYYDAPSESCPQKDLSSWEHNALFPSLFHISDFYFNQVFVALKDISAEHLIAILMFLFPDPQELAERITTGKELVSKYICPSCGATYYATPFAKEAGWGCPACDSCLPIDERFRCLVQLLGKGEYDIREPYASNGKRITLYHHACGNEIIISPRDFIYRGKRCKYCTSNSRRWDKKYHT